MNWRFWKKKKEGPDPKDVTIRALLEKLVDSTVMGTRTAIGYFNYVLMTQKQGFPIEDFEKRAEVHERLIAQHFDHFLRTIVSIAVLGTVDVGEYISRFPDSDFGIAASIHKERRGGIEVLMDKVFAD